MNKSEKIANGKSLKRNDFVSIVHSYTIYIQDIMDYNYNYLDEKI